MIDDKSCFKGRPFLTEKGAAKGKKSRWSPFFAVTAKSISKILQNTALHMHFLALPRARIPKWLCMYHREYIQSPRYGKRYSTEPGPVITVSTKRYGNLSMRNFTQVSNQKHMQNNFWGSGTGGNLSNFFCIYCILYASVLYKIFEDQLFHKW